MMPGDSQPRQEVAIELIAILGRGIQQVTQDGPWEVTEDLEVCDEYGAHLPVRIPAHDGHPHCLVGGGELNLYAGAELARLHAPTLKVVVRAYSARPPYLVSVDGPNESEVMSERLKTLLTTESPLDVLVWTHERTIAGHAGTNREIRNVFELVVERKLSTVGIVTVEVHCARALLMAQEHLTSPHFKYLQLQMYRSERVLLKQNPTEWEKRIFALHGSKAYQRTLAREEHGINCFLAGMY